MNKQDWKNFKNNSIRHVWNYAHASWVWPLFPNKFMAFLEKFKNGKKFFNSLQKIRFLITQKPIIPDIEYVVTTRCTMNCKHCNTFVPYFSDDSHVKSVTFETFKQDIDTLLKSIDYIYSFGFVGGETLLNKDLAKMIEYALSKRKIHHVFIATNCTILPNEELLKVMKHKKFAAHISDYRDVKKIKGGITVKYEEMKKLLLDNGIKISNHQENLNRSNWMTMPELYKDRQDVEKIIENFNRCFGQYCTMLSDGKILQCTISVYMERNLELTQAIKDEIVDIRAAKNSKELTDKIIKFYCRPYSEFCHYCHFENIQTGLPCGEQISAEEAALYIQNNKNL